MDYYRLLIKYDQLTLQTNNYRHLWLQTKQTKK